MTAEQSNELSSAPLWNDPGERPQAARRSAFPPLRGEAAADVCVVGLGGSGLTAIHELLDAGVSVIGIDSGVVAGGAAGRNGGLLLAGLAPFYHDARAVLGRDRARALYMATIDEQERVARATPHCVRRTGSLRIADSELERGDCAAQLDAMKTDGLPAAAYDGTWGTGLRFSTDLAFDPLARCRALAESAAKRGARLFEHTEALIVAADGVTTGPRPSETGSNGSGSNGSGSIRAGRVIVAIDGRLDLVLPELAGRVRTARLQMLGTAPARDVTLESPMYSRFGYEYAQQLPSGSIALGGFRDHFEADEWSHDATPTSDIQSLLTQFLRTRIGTEAKITHRWAASVGYCEGPLPILEEVRGGVIALGGYSGTGNLVGALCGRAAAQMALGRTHGLIDLLTRPTAE